MSIEGIAGCTTGPLEVRLFYSVLSSQAIERFVACDFNALLITQWVRSETLRTLNTPAAFEAPAHGPKKGGMFAIELPFETK
jgi:hypothetical protein